MRNSLRRRTLKALVFAHPIAGVAVFASGCLSSNPTAPPGEDAAFPVEDSSVPVLDSNVPIDSTVPVDSAPPVSDSAAPIDSTLPVDSAPGVDAADSAPAIGSIFGKVLDVNQFGQGVVAGATVSVVGGASTVTDLDGSFSLPSVVAGPRVLVTVTTPSNVPGGIAYSTAQVAVAVAGGQASEIYPQVVEGCIATAPVDADAGTTVTLQDGCSSRAGAFVSIAFDPGGLVDSTGTAFDGTLRLEAIPLAFAASAPQDLSWGVGLPGDMSGLETDGGLVKLESLGAAELRVFDDATGNPLTLASGHDAILELTTFRFPNAGETFDSWYYDTTTGLWVEAGSGAFTTVAVGSYTFDVYQVAVSRLAWWNIDHPLTETGCVRGAFTTGGLPLANGFVQGTGLDFLGTLIAYPQATAGAFCLDGVAGGHATLVAGQTLSPSFGYHGTQTGVSLGDGGASCAIDTTGCADLGTIALDPVALGCMTGTATLQTVENGTVPVTGDIPIFESVSLTGPQYDVGYSSSINLGVITADDAGAFCTPFLPGASVTATFPGSAGCALYNEGESVLYFPDDAGADAGEGVACGSSACVTGGDIFFGCS
jgi:hypothetical protein